MDALVEALGEAGYDVSSKDEEPLCDISRQIAQLSALSKDVEEATLALHQLSSSAAFDDLVNTQPVLQKIKLLGAIQGRISSILAAKEQVLSFVQKQHARGGSSMPVHAAHQESMQQLFLSVFEHLLAVEACLQAMDWSKTSEATLKVFFCVVLKLDSHAKPRLPFVFSFIFSAEETGGRRPECNG
jgi:hypothetical protein